MKRSIFSERIVEARKNELEGLIAPLNVSKAANSRRDGENIYKCVNDVAGYHCQACKCVMSNKGLQKPQI